MAPEVPHAELPDVDRLLTLLDARAAAGDEICALAAQALRQQATSGFTPDAMAAAVDRLVALVREQEAQIRALRAIIEAEL